MTPVPIPPTCPKDHPDLALVRKYWDAYRVHNPALTWSGFMNNLRSRLAFFREERMEREAKLAQIQTTRGPDGP